MTLDRLASLVAGWGGVVLLTALTALTGVASALLERSGPIRLRHWAEEAGGALRALYDAQVRFEVFRFLISWLAKLLPLALLFLVAGMLDRVGLGAWWSVGAVALLMGLTELVGRSLVGRAPEAALRRFTAPLRAARLVLGPLVLGLAPLFPAAVVERRDEEDDDVTDQEIEAFISVGAQEGILDPGEEDLIQRVIDFGDAVVRRVVTPRIDMVCAPADSGLEELAELFLSSNHSRIPLYRDTVDHIVGILHIRDLLRALRSGEAKAASELANEPYFVPETKPLDELLREFQAQRQQLAIVVDEYGGTSGLVTVEDLLEEIVGEIEDEYDDAAPVNEQLEEGCWRIDGRASLEVLEELFGVQIEEQPYETVGGLIFGHLGYVPQPGELLAANGLEFKVEKVDQRRIQSLRVRRAAHEEETVDGAG